MITALRTVSDISAMTASRYICPKTRAVMRSQRPLAIRTRGLAEIVTTNWLIALTMHPRAICLKSLASDISQPPAASLQPEGSPGAECGTERKVDGLLFAS